MNEQRNNYFKRLNDIFVDVFDDESIKLEDGTSAEDIEEWDSLMHISLMVATEKEFNLKLNAMEVSQLQNVGQMVDLLLKKTGIN